MVRASGVLCIVCLGVLSGCGDTPVLRDQYIGKSWLQPDKIEGPHPRDAEGNPIFTPNERRRLDADEEARRTSEQPQSTPRE